MGTLSRYITAKQQAPQQPVVSQPTTPAPPTVDTSNAIGSMAGLLGPTPEEKRQQEIKAQQSKAKMAAWTGLADGLRQFGNLYAAYKGAPAQKLSSPYEQIDKNYTEAMQRADSLQRYQQAYNTMLYNMRQQGEENARKGMLTKAQAQYYSSNNNPAVKNLKYFTTKSGAIIKHNPVTGETIELSPEDPEYIELMKERTNTERTRQKTMQQNADANTLRAKKAVTSSSKKTDKKKTDSESNKTDWSQYVRK